MDYTRGESIWINEDGTNQDAFFAGVINISLWQNNQQFIRDTLCVDLFTDIYLGVEYGTQLFDPSAFASRNLMQVSWLIDNALLPTQGPVHSSLLDSSQWVTTAAQGAGIQLAIWDLTTDGGDGFSSGRVQAATTVGQQTDPSALYWAQTYEALSSGKQSDLAFVYNNWSLSDGTPAQMLEGPMFSDGGPKPIPEPATYALTGLGLTVLGLLGRNFKKAPRP